MLKHPISAAVRLLPTILWVCVAAVGVFYFFRLQGIESNSEIQRTLLDRLFPYGFVALAVYGLRAAYSAFKEVKPALLADKPINLSLSELPRTPRAAALQRFTLSDTLRLRLQEAISALEETGVLREGEVSIDAAIECAELTDEFNEIAFYEVMHILRAMQEQRDTPYYNLAFFQIQVEMNHDSIVAMVRDIARLAGQADALRTINVGSSNGQPAFAREDAFPSSNAQVEFELAGRQYVVPFVMYRKNLPTGLFDELAKIFVQHTPGRRLVSAYCDLLVIAIVAAERGGELERYFPDQFEPYQR